MTYLYRLHGQHAPADIEALETDERVAAFEARGYRRCSAADWRALWTWNDALALWAMRRQVKPAARAVGVPAEFKLHTA